MGQPCPFCRPGAEETGRTCPLWESTQSCLDSQPRSRHQGPLLGSPCTFCPGQWGTKPSPMSPATCQVPSPQTAVHCPSLTSVRRAHQVSLGRCRAAQHAPCSSAHPFAHPLIPLLTLEACVVAEAQTQTEVAELTLCVTVYWLCDLEQAWHLSQCPILQQGFRGLPWTRWVCWAHPSLAEFSPMAVILASSPCRPSRGSSGHMEEGPLASRKLGSAGSQHLQPRQDLTPKASYDEWRGGMGLGPPLSLGCVTWAGPPPPPRLPLWRLSGWHGGLRIGIPKAPWIESQLCHRH